MKTLQEINEEYWRLQGLKESHVISTSIIDDLLVTALRLGYTELQVEPADMQLIIMFIGAAIHPYRPENWFEIIKEGWIDKFMGITMTGNLVTLFLDPSNQIGISLGDPAQNEKSSPNFLRTAD